MVFSPKEVVFIITLSILKFNLYTLTLNELFAGQERVLWNAIVEHIHILHPLNRLPPKMSTTLKIVDKKQIIKAFWPCVGNQSVWNMSKIFMEKSIWSMCYVNDSTMLFVEDIFNYFIIAYFWKHSLH